MNGAMRARWYAKPVKYLMSVNSKILIGTSGWHYDHWKGPFYPGDISNEDMLTYYCEHFNTVEINNTFYKLPDKSTLENWKNTVPSDFVFSVKASRYITHMKKLNDPSEPVSRFLEGISVLKEKLGTILFQLPPRWKVNTDRLHDFLKLLTDEFRYCFEFRDSSWFSGDVYDLLSEFGASFCIYDLDGTVSPCEVTADLVYVRLHGPDGPYKGKYGKTKLGDWVEHIKSWTREGNEVFVYFDNDESGYAAMNADQLRDMIPHA